MPLVFEIVNDVLVEQQDTTRIENSRKKITFYVALKVKQANTVTSSNGNYLQKYERDCDKAKSVRRVALAAAAGKLSCVWLAFGSCLAREPPTLLKMPCISLLLKVLSFKHDSFVR